MSKSKPKNNRAPLREKVRLGYQKRVYQLLKIMIEAAYIFFSPDRKTLLLRFMPNRRKVAFIDTIHKLSQSTWQELRNANLTYGLEQKNRAFINNRVLFPILF